MPGNADCKMFAWVASKEFLLIHYQLYAFLTVLFPTSLWFTEPIWTEVVKKTWSSTLIAITSFLSVELTAFLKSNNQRKTWSSTLIAIPSFWLRIFHSLHEFFEKVIFVPQYSHKWAFCKQMLNKIGCGTSKKLKKTNFFRFFKNDRGFDIWSL